MILPGPPPVLAAPAKPPQPVLPAPLPIAAPAIPIMAPKPAEVPEGETAEAVANRTRKNNLITTFTIQSHHMTQMSPARLISIYFQEPEQEPTVNGRQPRRDEIEFMQVKYNLKHECNEER